MAYSNSSAAYDLTAYELPKERAKPQLKLHKTPQKMVSAVLSPRVLSSFAIVVTLLCLIVYNQVQLNEVSGEINSLSKQLELLESENIKLTSELESTINLRTIGEQAKSELGMKRLDQYQTEYIELYQEDRIQLTQDSPDVSLGQKIKITITAAVNRLQEYISGQ